MPGQFRGSTSATGSPYAGRTPHAASNRSRAASDDFLAEEGSFLEPGDPSGNERALVVLVLLIFFIVFFRIVELIFRFISRALVAFERAARAYYQPERGGGGGGVPGGGGGGAEYVGAGAEGA